MKIVVAHDSGQVFQYLGHTQTSKLYEVTSQEVTATGPPDTNDNGHSAPVTLLRANQVGTLICGGIGDGAKSTFAEAGIELYDDACGDAGT